jgi:hypothetical protein
MNEARLTMTPKAALASRTRDQAAPNAQGPSEDTCERRRPCPALDDEEIEHALDALELAALNLALVAGMPSGRGVLNEGLREA